MYDNENEVDLDKLSDQLGNCKKEFLELKQRVANDLSQQSVNISKILASVWKAIDSSIDYWCFSEKYKQRSSSIETLKYNKYLKWRDKVNNTLHSIKDTDTHSGFTQSLPAGYFVEEFLNEIKIEEEQKSNSLFDNTQLRQYTRSLDKDICLMIIYELQDHITTKYFYYTNVKNYKDFIEKFKTITEIAKQSEKLAEEYKKTSIKCFKYACFWFLLCWFTPIAFDIIKYKCGFEYSLPNDYFGEIFVFLSKLLFKLPSFVLCFVGVKFLFLFVQYKTEKRELSMLDTFLEKIPSNLVDKKAELVKQLATHFFPDKKANKISQGFSQELMLKMVDKNT